MLAALCVLEMNSDYVGKELENLNKHEKAMLLLTYGHQLTIMARDAYEFQGPGVTKPRLLRDTNEILHRIFQAVRELEADAQNCFVLGGIAQWIACEGKSAEIREASTLAFTRALSICST